MVAPNAVCGANAIFGSVCEMACAPGSVPVSGSTISTCQGQRWSSLPLVCQAPCDVGFVVPANVAETRVTIMAENFNDTQAAIQGRWLPLDNRQQFGEYWNVVDNQLQVSGWVWWWWWW